MQIAETKGDEGIMDFQTYSILKSLLLQLFSFNEGTKIDLKKPLY